MPRDRGRARGAVENFPNLKGLEDEAEELEELSKLALSPVGVYSTQVSPNPCDGPDDATTERAEEALDLISSSSAAVAADRGTEESPTPVPEQTTAAKNNGRRTSHSWRGLKKQLSRVDLRLKNTFNAAPAKKASTFYSGEQPENEETTNTPAAGGLPQIITETDGGAGGGQEQRTDGGGGNSDQSSAAAAAATRPTELKLFDRDGKPIKPPRSAKEQQPHRKRTSLDKQGNLTAAAGSRDGRLLSVPNIKYSQRDTRHNRSNNQAFINLIKKLSKFNSKNPQPPTTPIHTYPRTQHTITRWKRVRDRDSRNLFPWTSKNMNIGFLVFLLSRVQTVFFYFFYLKRDCHFDHDLLCRTHNYVTHHTYTHIHTHTTHTTQFYFVSTSDVSRINATNNKNSKWTLKKHYHKYRTTYIIRLYHVYRRHVIDVCTQTRTCPRYPMVRFRL